MKIEHLFGIELSQDLLGAICFGLSFAALKNFKKNWIAEKNIGGIKLLPQQQLRVSCGDAGVD